jgi:hypothetical protein
VAYEGDCDDGCFFLADHLGFGDELREMVKIEHERIDKESGNTHFEQKEAAEEESKDSSDDKPEEEQSKEKLLKESDVKDSDVKSSI